MTFPHYLIYINKISIQTQTTYFHPAKSNNTFQLLMEKVPRFLLKKGYRLTSEDLSFLKRYKWMQVCLRKIVLNKRFYFYAVLCLLITIYTTIAFYIKT